jgi:putative ABC transport system substrate-binding protein
VRRRDFVALGGAAALPMAAHAQQPAMPVVGWLAASGPDTNAYQLRGFRQGLKETGLTEGENVAFEYRWAENQLDRLPALAAELVRRRIAVIAAGAPPATAAAKAATSTIPIVFVMAQDPVRLGLVASLARPGGNLTGVNFQTTELAAKRLELLHQLVPKAVRIAVLTNPANTATSEANVREAETAARALGLQINVFNANTSAEIDTAFAGMARERPDALYVSSGPYFTGRRVQLVHLATRHAIPAIFGNREHSDVGGLMSYGANVTDGYRRMGVYAGRVLKGTKPADLPIIQTDKFELVINAQTARTLGINVPPTLLARADEVIE